MKYAIQLFNSVAVLGLLPLSSLLFGSTYAAAADKGFVSQTAEIDGVKLHYTTGGHGPALILLHGYAETSRMWTPLLPLLGEKFTVIAPDLPGIGDSGIPANGLDMKAAAIRIHGLARSLGVEKARVVGHDIGLMVAYAYAAQFPAEVEKLVVMDAFLRAWKGGRGFTTIQGFGISVSTGRRQKSW
jgi:pimeloyl-ACP methyl ester carboxylesterase